jgi:ATP-binding cassette subfamily F protein 2
MDEPTNHLDLGTCVWLERHLAKYPHCLVCISHSQDFLDGVCTEILHLTIKGTLEIYGGNYSTFVKTREERETNTLKKYEKEQDDIKHLQEFIRSCGTFSNLRKQAESKQKIIDKMEAAGLTQKPLKDPTYRFRFPDTDKLPPPVCAFQNVAFSYSGKLADILYSNLELGIDCDSRIALVGPNGAGKSTLLKLMMGEIVPIEGAVQKKPASSHRAVQPAQPRAAGLDEDPDRIHAELVPGRHHRREGPPQDGVRGLAAPDRTLRYHRRQADLQNGYFFRRVLDAGGLLHHVAEEPAHARPR